MVFVRSNCFNDPQLSTRQKLKRQLESEGRRDERARALDHARVAAPREEHRRARDDEEVLVLERSELRADAQVRADAVAYAGVARYLPEHSGAREAKI